MSKQLRIYGAGGAGINLVSRYVGKEEEKNCASPLPAFIDTSASNLRKHGIDPSETFLVEGLDGSGKVRRENAAEISRSIKQVLVEIEPTEMNIVVFSASGGSGSVVGPLLIKELISRDIPVVAVVIGSDESVISAENTLKTLQSLESIAKTTDTPVVMSYHYNDPSEKRSVVDRDVWHTIACLMVLMSGENHAMDRLDLVHWLRYNKVNAEDPRLAALNVVTSNDQYQKLSDVVSVASLYKDADTPHTVQGADYQAVGYVDLDVIGLEEVHFAITLNEVVKIGKSIREKVDKMMETRNARVRTDAVLDKSTVSDDDGMVY